VAVAACGVCQTDLHYREGPSTTNSFLLGHEAAGTVEAVGEGVTNVAPGDYVCWLGVLRADVPLVPAGAPWYCFESATPPNR